jgi:hypothetical protein
MRFGLQFPASVFGALGCLWRHEQFHPVGVSLFDVDRVQRQLARRADAARAGIGNAGEFDLLYVPGRAHGLLRGAEPGKRENCRASKKQSGSSMHESRLQDEI